MRKHNQTNQYLIIPLHVKKQNEVPWLPNNSVYHSIHHFPCPQRCSLRAKLHFEYNAHSSRNLGFPVNQRYWAGKYCATSAILCNPLPLSDVDSCFFSILFDHTFHVNKHLGSVSLLHRRAVGFTQMQCFGEWGCGWRKR